MVNKLIYRRNFFEKTEPFKIYETFSNDKLI